MTLDQFVFKFFGWLITIDQLILFFLFLGVILLFTRYWKWGRRATVTGLSILFFTSILPTGFWLMSWLENRFPKQTEIPADAKGLILLGGSFDFMVTVDRDQPSYNPTAGRMIDFVELANRYPDLPILFTGGGRSTNPRANEALNAKHVLEGLGLDMSRVTFESESKDTLENASNSYKIINPQPGDKWVLVTSAYHMPKAVGSFEAAGWDVFAYPVDYHSISSYPWYFINFNISMGLLAWASGIREIGRMSTNYLAGTTNTWIPKG